MFSYIGSFYLILKSIVLVDVTIHCDTMKRYTIYFTLLFVIMVFAPFQGQAETIGLGNITGTLFEGEEREFEFNSEKGKAYSFSLSADFTTDFDLYVY